MTPGPTRLWMPSTGLTVYSGFTCELPPPPLIAAPANGPTTAIERSAVASSGSVAPEFFSSTAACWAMSRDTAPSLTASIGVTVCGRSKMPNRIIVRRIRKTCPSMVAWVTVPTASAALMAALL